MRKAICGLAMLIAVLASAPAFAQTGYPPGPGTGPEVEVKDFGTVRPGDGFQKEDCGFTAGSTVTVSFNGGGAGTAVAGGDGCVRLDVEVIDANTVSIEGRRLRMQCGRQVITVAGADADGGDRVAQNGFFVPCGEAARGDAARSDGGLSDTGANVGRWLTVAGLLIAIGAAFVVADRRRSRASRA